MNPHVEQLLRDVGPNPWRQIVPGRPPYVLPEDREAVEHFNRSAEPEHRIQLEVFPEPFVGNPLAPLVLLNLNPGFKPAQIEAHAHPLVSKLLVRTLRLETADEETPFHHLHPDYREHSQSKWWPRCFRGWIERFGMERVARSFFCVEYFPYASKRYKSLGSLLPSQQFGFELVRAKVRAGATVIVMRRQKSWVGQLADLDINRWIEVVNPQAGSVNPPNPLRRGDPGPRRKGNLRIADAERIRAAIEAWA